MTTAFFFVVSLQSEFLTCPITHWIWLCAQNRKEMLETFQCSNTSITPPRMSRLYYCISSSLLSCAQRSAHVCDTSYPNPAAVVLLWSNFSEPNLEFENVQHERSPPIRAEPCELLSVAASTFHFHSLICPLIRSIFRKVHLIGKPLLNNEAMKSFY